MATRAFRVSRKNLADLNRFGKDEVDHILLETTEGLLYIFHGRSDGTNSGDLSIVNDPDVAFCACCYPGLTNYQAVYNKLPVEFRRHCQPMILVWEFASRVNEVPLVIGSDRDEAYDLAETLLTN